MRSWRIAQGPSLRFYRSLESHHYIRHCTNLLTNSAIKKKRKEYIWDLTSSTKFAQDVHQVKARKPHDYKTWGLLTNKRFGRRLNRRFNHVLLDLHAQALRGKTDASPRTFSSIAGPSAEPFRSLALVAQLPFPMQRQNLVAEPQRTCQENSAPQI